MPSGRTFVELRRIMLRAEPAGDTAKDTTNRLRHALTLAGVRAQVALVELEPEDLRRWQAVQDVLHALDEQGAGLAASG